jgi:hypothetical protein
MHVCLHHTLLKTRCHRLSTSYVGYGEASGELPYTKKKGLLSQTEHNRAINTKITACIRVVDNKSDQRQCINIVTKRSLLLLIPIYCFKNNILG